MSVCHDSLISIDFEQKTDIEKQKCYIPKFWTTVENMGWLRPLGLKLCQHIDLDEENLNLMSVCSESLIFDRFRFRNSTSTDVSAVGGMPAKPVNYPKKMTPRVYCWLRLPQWLQNLNVCIVWNFSICLETCLEVRKFAEPPAHRRDRPSVPPVLQSFQSCSTGILAC